jgi:glycosyltransferase 2 family protein
MKSFIKFLLFFAVGLSILYFVYQNQAGAFEAECACKGDCPYKTLWEKVLYDFSQANMFWLAVVCLAYIASVLSRALRWNLLIEPLGYKVKTFNTFFSIMIGYLVNLALPRAGEIAKPAALNQYEKVPLDKLMGTILVDRVFDVIMLLLVVGLTFLLQFDNIYGFLSGTTRPAATCVNPVAEVVKTPFVTWTTLFLIAGAIMLLSLILIIWKWQAIKQTKIYQRVYLLMVNFGEGIKSVFRLRSPFLFLFHTLFIWFMYFMMTLICFWAYAPTADLGFSPALLAFVFGGFGVLIPSPGGMGTYQIAVMAALVVFGVAKSDAFAFANIIFFTINIFCNLIFGLLAYLLMPIYNKNYNPVKYETEALDRH